jgi:hypothetical protein
MIITLGQGYTAEWERGSHTINYFDNNGANYDCITFSWEKDRPNQMDAWNAFYTRETDYI